MAAANKLRDFMTGVMGQHPPRVQSWISSLDDATAARMLAAAEAGDTRTILKAMAAEKDWGVTPRAPEPAAPAGGSRSPMSFEDRVSNDPNIRRAIEASGAAMPTGGADDVLNAYRGTFARRGRPSSAEDSIRELAKPADQVAAEGIAGQFDRVIQPAMDAPPRQMELQFPEPPAPPRSPSPALVDDMTFDEVPSRPMSHTPAPRKFPKRAAAAAVGGAAGLGLMMSRDDEPAVTSGGEADLVEESRPAPQVASTPVVPEPTVAQAPRDYSMEARALINRLNDMRRAAGGEVPEAPAMMAEINRLMALGNQTRRATMVAAPQDDASRLFQQAQSLIDQVNQMYRQGMTPNSPEVQRIMAQVRQLQAQGDAIRNRRAG